ncbi:hypothetical protein BDV10DRAFT_160209 [Aspergillus recurvatus]
MMESAAARLDLIERSKPDTDIARAEAVATEYYMLRIYLVSSISRQRVPVSDKRIKGLVSETTSYCKPHVLEDP